MNDKLKKILGIGFIGLATLSAGSVAVSAFNDGVGFGKMPFSQSDGLKSAIENNDYETFNELSPRDVSQEQFDVMVTQFDMGREIQDAIANEDYDAFVAAHEDLEREVPTQDQFNEMILRHQAHEKVEQAIHEGNYDLWVSASQDLPHAQGMAELISEDEFDLLVEMHEAREDGDFETAHDLADELGIEAGPHQRGGMPGFGRGEGPKGDMSKNSLDERPMGGEGMHSGSPHQGTHQRMGLRN